MPSPEPTCRTIRRRVACLLLTAFILHPAAQADDAAAPTAQCEGRVLVIS